MARLVTELTIETRGFNECQASLGSIGEALQNACLEVDLELAGSQLLFQGMPITKTDGGWEGLTYVLCVRPAPAIVLFVGWLMVKLPSRASVRWRGGWPHIYCPPHDDRDVENDPSPLTPNELEPA